MELLLLNQSWRSGLVKLVFPPFRNHGVGKHDCQLLHAPREEDRFPVSAPTNRYRYGVLHLRLEENSFFSNIMQCHDSRWNKDYLSSLMSDEDVLDFQCY
ncbi:hypothetical protein V6N13_129441 [Hibiscus sabdariffa]